MFTSIPPIVVTPPAEDDDKRPLWFSSTPQRVIGPNPSSFSRHSRLYLAIGTTIFAVCTILLTALIHGVPRVEGAFTQSERAHDAELRAQRRFGVLARRAEGGDETFATYVTTVDAEGDTSTLVYTTRPIVSLVLSRRAGAGKKQAEGSTDVSGFKMKGQSWRVHHRNLNRLRPPLYDDHFHPDLRARSGRRGNVH